MCIFIHAHTRNSRKKILPVSVMCSTTTAHFHNIRFFMTCCLFLLLWNKPRDNDSADHKLVLTWLMRNTGRSSAWNQTIPFWDVLHTGAPRLFSAAPVPGPILACKNGCRLQTQQLRDSLANLAVRFQWSPSSLKIRIFCCVLLFTRTLLRLTTR